MPPEQLPPQDFSLLDRPEIRFALFYPRPDRTPGPAGSRDVMVPVSPGVEVHLRWHPLAPDAPVVLFFHGNGEVVSDYDEIAAVNRAFGMALCVAEYRGYGRSGGQPGFGAMLADAVVIADRFHEMLDAEGVTGPRFLMGRSLGALSAVEVAARQPERFRGLILESGTAGVRGWARFAPPGDDPARWEALRQGQLAKLHAISLPLLTIHGAEDELIPLETALEVQVEIGSAEKELEVIPYAGHNDLLELGLDRYFGVLRAFVERHGGQAATE